MAGCTPFHENEFAGRPSRWTYILAPSHSTNEVTSQDHNQCAHSEDFNIWVVDVVPFATAGS
eukprot:scaffold105922_cov58-Attheya_sp.AAC.3